MKGAEVLGRCGVERNTVRQMMVDSVKRMKMVVYRLLHTSGLHLMQKVQSERNRSL